MKATSLLEAQHRTVEALIETIESRQASVSGTLNELANTLGAHMVIEQDLFYPAIKQVDATLVSESYEEHALAEVALKRLLATDPSDAAFKARVTALKELLEHHVTEEEEELFPQVEEALGEEALLALGKLMRARFAEVYETGFEAATPKGVSRTSADVAQRTLARRETKKDKSATV